MGRKTFKIIADSIAKVYYAIADDKKFRLCKEFINPDIKTVIVNKLGIPICVNVRTRVSKSKI